MLLTTMHEKHELSDSPKEGWLAGLSLARLPALGPEATERVALQLRRWPRVSGKKLERSRPLAGHPRVIAWFFDEADRLVHSDPHQAKRAAATAVACSTATISLSEDRELAWAVQAMALAALANVERVLGLHAKAERRFNRAIAGLDKGCASAPLRAEVARKQATLFLDCRRFPEAESGFRGATELFRRANQPMQAARCALMVPRVVYAQGHIGRAFRESLSAIRQVDPEQDPGLYFGALHSQIGFLTELNKPDHALALSEALDRAYPCFGGELTQLRKRWVRGKIAVAMREWAIGARIFDQVRKGFLERDLAYDASLVSLELALCWAELHQPREVMTLAEEMFGVFTAQQIPREASAALILFAEAAKKLQADEALIRGTLTKIDEARRAAPTP